MQGGSLPEIQEGEDLVPRDTEVADIFPACSCLLHVIKIEWDGDLRRRAHLAGEVGFF